MHFQFLLSDPNGDIELAPEDLEQPFLIGPNEPHPSLLLADYFGALKDFILLDDGKALVSAMQKQGIKADLTLSDITKAIIRSEKHGAFYHIASVEIPVSGEKIKFAITSALSESAKASLGEEYFILQELSELTPNRIPEIYCKESVSRKTDSGHEDFLMVLGEWLNNYHEWHLSDNPKSEKRRIHLWDYENGYRYLSDTESHEMLRQVAYILTSSYDQGSCRQIYPWHHGAGDFIVRAEPDAISVKLITARQYKPLVQFEEAKETDRLVAAIQFLLNLTIRVRLDRLDGVGEPAWIGAFALQATLEGFFDGLDATQAEDRLLIGSAQDFLEIMQSFDRQEILDMYESLMEIYAGEDQDDFHLIQKELSSHASELHEALQDFSRVWQA